MSHCISFQKKRGDSQAGMPIPRLKKFAPLQYFLHARLMYQSITRTPVQVFFNNCIQNRTVCIYCALFNGRVTNFQHSENPNLISSLTQWCDVGTFTSATLGAPGKWGIMLILLSISNIHILFTFCALIDQERWPWFMQHIISIVPSIQFTKPSFVRFKN